MDETEYMIYLVLMVLAIVLGWVNVHTIFVIYAICKTPFKLVFNLISKLVVRLTK